MSISNNYAPDKSLGNGATLVFTGDWKVLNASYFRGALQSVATGALTPLALGSDYTLTFNDAGYTMTLLIPAPTSDFYILRYREVEVDQTDPYRTSKGFQGKVIEDSFDKLTAIDQDQQDQIDRSLKFGIGSTFAGYGIEDPIQNNILIWDVANQMLVNGGDAANIQNAEQYANEAEASAELAESWAIDPIGDRPEGSAKYWAELAAVSAGNFDVDRFDGNDTAGPFMLSNPSALNNTQGYIDGCYQQKNSYSVDPVTGAVTLSEILPTGSVLEFVYSRANAQVVNVPAAGSVTVPSFAASVYANQSEAEVGTENTKIMTPLRVAQSIAIRAIPRVQAVASAATVTPTNLNDIVTITAQAAALTLANPSGTMVEGQAMVIRIKDNGTARAISYGANYRAVGVVLPTTTVITKTIYLFCIWNNVDGKFDVTGVALGG